MLDFAGLVEVEHASNFHSNLRLGFEIWQKSGDFLSMIFILFFSLMQDMVEDHSLFSVQGMKNHSLFHLDFAFG